MSRESVDTESCCSSLHVEEFVDSDEEDIAEKRIKHLEDYQFVLEIKLKRNQGKFY